MGRGAPHPGEWWGHIYLDSKYRCPVIKVWFGTRSTNINSSCGSGGRAGCPMIVGLAVQTVRHCVVGQDPSIASNGTGSAMHGTATYWCVDGWSGRFPKALWEHDISWTFCMSAWKWSFIEKKGDSQSTKFEQFCVLKHICSILATSAGQRSTSLKKDNVFKNSSAIQVLRESYIFNFWNAIILENYHYSYIVMPPYTNWATIFFLYFFLQYDFRHTMYMKGTISRYIVVRAHPI